MVSWPIHLFLGERDLNFQVSLSSVVPWTSSRFLLQILELSVLCVCDNINLHFPSILTYESENNFQTFSGFFQCSRKKSHFYFCTSCLAKYSSQERDTPLGVISAPKYDDYILYMVKCSTENKLYDCTTFVLKSKVCLVMSYTCLRPRHFLYHNYFSRTPYIGLVRIIFNIF